MAPRSLRLPRSRRIRQRADFARIRREGGRFSHTHLILNWLLLPKDTFSRLGIIVSRRVGPAVVRSRVRRLVRESFRLHQAEFDKPAAIVVIAKPSMASRQFAQIEADFRAALGQARLLKASS